MFRTTSPSAVWSPSTKSGRPFLFAVRMRPLLLYYSIAETENVMQNENVSLIDSNENDMRNEQISTPSNSIVENDSFADVDFYDTDSEFKNCAQDSKKLLLICH
jgi:hypothetical protein